MFLRRIARLLIGIAAPLIFLFGLSSCGAPLSPAAFSATPEAKALQDLVTQLAAHDFAAIEAQLDASSSTPATHDVLVKMSHLLPGETPSAITPAAWSIFVMKGVRKVDVAAEYDYPSRRVLAKAVLLGDAGHFKVLGFHIEPLTASLSEANAFTFEGKSAVHFFFLAATLLAIAISIFALVQCIRTKDLRRKWLWIVFILFGVISFTLNWTTGALELKPLSINVLSAACSRNGWIGPWTLTLSIPLGAILFLLRQARERRAA